MSFKDYERQHTEPQPLPEYIADEARADFEETERERRETVAELKASITHRLTVAAAPQEVLREALRAIGILTNSEEWAEGCILQVSAIYDFPESERPASFTEATAAAEEYREKLRRKLTREKSKLDRITAALEIFINDIDDIGDDRGDQDNDDDFLLDIF